MIVILRVIALVLVIVWVVSASLLTDIYKQSIMELEGDIKSL